MRILLTTLAFLLVAGFALETAHAHDPWESNGFAYNAAAPDDMVLRTNRGVVFSEDGGQTWRLLCRLAFDNFLPAIGVTTESTALLGTFDGLSTISTAGCDNRELFTPMSGLWVSDLQRDPIESESWFATTSRGQAANGVFRSEDDGFTWQPIGDLDASAFFKQVRPSADGQVIYAGVAQYFAPTENAAERVDYSVRSTSDNGASWATHPITLNADDKEMVLLDVDPQDPQRVFVGIHACREDNRCFDETRGQQKDRVLVSNNGGSTWSLLFEVDEIAAFEIDNEHIWVGDWQGGFWRLNADGSSPVLLDGRLKPGCLHATDTELFVCGTDIFGFMLARSTDDGTTLEPVATSANILGNPVCAPSDVDGGFNSAVSCRMEWADLCRESYVDEPNPPMECVGILDAGVPMAMDGGVQLGTPTGGGCSCSVTGSQRSASVGSLGALGGLWLFGFSCVWLVTRTVRRRFRPTLSARS